VALRERLGLSERQVAGLLASLLRSPAIDEAACLCTCNRTELYLLARDAGDAERAATRALAAIARMRPEDLAATIQTRHGAEAARHLFRVTAGLDSLVPGEAEIQGQVRRAYQRALSLGSGGRIVNRLFQDALRTGKRVRTETDIRRRPASVASVAVELARRELGDLSGRRALVIGTGKHGALTARALTDAGAATVFVANRDPGRAEDLARRFGGRAVSFDDLLAELRRCDLVLTGTSCPHRILTRADLAAAVGARQLVVVDTAVPRDVEPDAADLPGVTLHDLDAIEREVARNRTSRADEVQRAEPIIDEETANFARWLASLEVVPIISALRERGRVAVDRVLQQNAPRWQALTDADRERVEVLARAVVSDLLHEPTVQLRRAGERGSSARYVEAVRDLFGLPAG
jgi:glutamyl-tRNA reductase